MLGVTPTKNQLSSAPAVGVTLNLLSLLQILFFKVLGVQRLYQHALNDSYNQSNHRVPLYLIT